MTKLVGDISYRSTKYFNCKNVDNRTHFNRSYVAKIEKAFLIYFEEENTSCSRRKLQRYWCYYFSEFSILGLKLSAAVKNNIVKKTAEQ